MMKNNDALLQNPATANIWSIFDQITKIPRPSKKEEKIRAYLRQFASSRNLAVKEDAKGNIVILKPATAGYQSVEGVILQSHMDMVCEKESTSTHNFDTDPIQTYVKDGWMYARQTTLGADCGIGMAIALAVLDDHHIAHPQIEALFTVDEEQGLSGANELGADMLTLRRMINLDSEDEGEIFIGCAGGVDTVARYDFEAQKSPADRYTYYNIVVGSLVGGHSGDDIEKGRANANKLLVRFLRRMVVDFDVLLCDIDGGNLRNAIPREATATVGVPTGRVDVVVAFFDELAAQIKAEYAVTEPSMSLSMNVAERAQIVIDKDVTRALLLSLQGVVNGVVAWSSTMPGLVETSTNLASVKVVGSVVEVVTSQRSSIQSAKMDVANTVESAFLLGGGVVAHSDGYPGWTPNPSSPFVAIACELYEQLFGKSPKVRAIHAGLECGLFLRKFPSLDMISIGPTLRGVHSPSERLEIASVELVWRHLLSILSYKSRLGEKKL